MRALRDKKIYIVTLVMSEKNFLNETKNHNPPFQVKWSVPKIEGKSLFFVYIGVPDVHSS